MRNNLFYGVAAAALMLPGAAYAQSTGTQTFEKDEIVVVGKRAASVDGVAVSDSPKARQSLDQTFISAQTPGQSVDDIINYLPGVSFQNNGPYGDAGGTLTIHGFDDSRISQTFDGVPVNDSGNYALYSQEQIDPELIQQITVSLGSTDIDSPTASATGSTVNYVTRDPSKDFHVRLEGSAGDWDFMRVFGVIDTGELTKSGTRAFFAVSHQNDYDPYNKQAKIDKTQINAKLYQPIGSNGDFISIAGFYNRGRGNHFGDVYLRNDKVVTGVGAPAGFPSLSDLRDYVIPVCTTTAPTPKVADKANTCGTVYDYGINPSNIARFRVNSRFTLADGLTLTVDPNAEFTKINSSAAVTATEGTYKVTGSNKLITGFISGKPYLGGVDLNGDGDILDTVEVNAPTNTITDRYGVIANLIYEVTPTQTVRVNYTLDHARLRQTGELGYLLGNGRPASTFPIDNPILDSTGNPIEKRNRLSYSILNQVAGEYRGKFFDNRLVLTAGLRAPFFTRDLTNHCVAESSGNGYVDCFNDATSQAAFLAANPKYQGPQSRHFEYNRVLPSAGFTYNFAGPASVFFDYSQGLQVPSTDDLYDGFAFPTSDPLAKPKAETTYNFEGGLRYRTSHLQAQLSGWYTAYHNRIEENTIEDPLNPGSFLNVYTNLGRVHKYGVDGSIAYAPIKQVTLYAFGSYLHSKIEDDLLTGQCTANNVKFKDSAGTGPCTTVGQSMYVLTGGKQEAGAPTYTFGGRIQGNFGPFELGAQAKRTGPRWVNDQNTPFYASTTVGSAVVYPTKTPAYTLVDLNARVKLGFLGLNDSTYFQLNVTNLFDKFYVGGFSGSISNTRIPYVYIGTPRTISGTINVAF